MAPTEPRRWTRYDVVLGVVVITLGVSFGGCDHARVSWGWHQPGGGWSKTFSLMWQGVVK
jgi:hypothetical protein